MRLIEAHFKNFRSLRDLRLDLAVDDDKKLVVIRASNESGKTTVLNALRWGLYGDKALPTDRTEYRIHPLDWDGEKVPISVEIIYETSRTLVSRRTGAKRIESTRYRIVRNTSDTITGQEWRHGSSEVQLYELTNKGDEEIISPDIMIHGELPDALRDIFFTDGDRALSFIEAGVTAKVKQDRVRGAIRNLLGLDVVQESVKRVKRAAQKVSNEIANRSSDLQLKTVLEQIGEKEKSIERIEDQIESANISLKSFRTEYDDAERKIEEALSHGDRESVMTRLHQTLKVKKTLVEHLDAADRRRGALFESERLARDLLSPAVESGFAILDELRERGDIPNSTIPVLEDRLTMDVCICGERLMGDHPEVSQRREHINHLIEGARDRDAVRDIATNLYFKSESLRTAASSDSGWCKRLADVEIEWEEIEDRLDEINRTETSQEAELKAIPDTDVAKLRDYRESCKAQMQRFSSDIVRDEMALKSDVSDLADLKNSYQRLTRHQGIGDRLRWELEAARDIEAALSKAYARLTREEVDKVSQRMEDIFLEMIVADKEQESTIRKAEITSDFAITVYGFARRPLNPDVDLNGASRRALTLAFILALTQVSEVVAPNVIDTPLGMMAGEVKSSVLSAAIRESSQLLLLLTPSEIAGCEDTLDAKVARVMTLSNTAHYPAMLANPPEACDQRIVRCDCSHRQSCRVCERRLVSETSVSV